MIIRNNSTFLAAKKREKSKEIIGSLIHNSCVYISCIFLCFSNYCMYEEKNLWSGLHDFKSFLFFLCLLIPEGIKSRRTQFVCIVCRLWYMLLFAYLSFPLSHSSVRSCALFLSAQFMSSTREAVFYYSFSLSFSYTLSFSFYHHFFSFFSFRPK